METTYTIENTFNDLKERSRESYNFYATEFCHAEGKTEKILWKIVDIFWNARYWIYDIEKTDENYLKYINKILKAYKKAKKYTDLLTY